MTTLPEIEKTKLKPSNEDKRLAAAIAKSWSKIAPFWPLKNLIAVNPLAGFEDMRFEQALTAAYSYFQQKNMPPEMEDVNRESIKWLQVFFDQGQSTLRMPHRKAGLLKSTLALIRFDARLHQHDREKLSWLRQLPAQPEDIIQVALHYLGIARSEHETFLTLLLTTLPGWAAHVVYRTQWADEQDAITPIPVTQADYLAFRLVVTCLIWPEARLLLDWHSKASREADTTAAYQAIVSNETSFTKALMRQLAGIEPPAVKSRPDAQLVFCIDVRSEPFRRAIESQGKYETYGFAGFFGIPASFTNPVSAEKYASCPVLLKPVVTVQEVPAGSRVRYKEGYSRLQLVKKLYQTLKYNFTTPFNLVDILGLPSGVWMGLRTLSPMTAAAVQSAVMGSIALRTSLVPDVGEIAPGQQVAFAANALRLMGLDRHFAPLVVFCGHGSTTQNNAYATALDCGACGGRHGGPNAKLLAGILNNQAVRDELRRLDIDIPDDTIFLAAEHDTTTDEVEIFTDGLPDRYTMALRMLRQDLVIAGKENSFVRSVDMGAVSRRKISAGAAVVRSRDWAQVRPEWGLAGNAAFIAAPRWLTEGVNLYGRAFLHSYDWEKDSDLSHLSTILTAPMVVAQWINAQYLFSTLDNAAFGGGSKVTSNITGKLGIMQGNSSDLMHGLPLQSVYSADGQPYHTAQRLTAIVYAPRERVGQVIRRHLLLCKLLGNEWIRLLCLDPRTDQAYVLRPDLTWEL